MKWRLKEIPRTSLLLATACWSQKYPKIMNRLFVTIGSFLQVGFNKQKKIINIIIIIITHNNTTDSKKEEQANRSGTHKFAKTSDHFRCYHPFPQVLSKSINDRFSPKSLNPDKLVASCSSLLDCFTLMIGDGKTRSSCKAERQPWRPQMVKNPDFIHNLWDPYIVYLPTFTHKIQLNKCRHICNIWILWVIHAFTAIYSFWYWYLRLSMENRNIPQFMSLKSFANGVQWKKTRQYRQFGT